MSHTHSGAGGFTAPMILCCVCGVQIESNPANMCSHCLQARVDITEGIPKSLTIFWCRNCGRYQRPPWVVAELESKEMLAMCLKKIKGLNKEVKLIDAAFIWTEPHSRRIKIKLTVQKEIFNGVIMQQSFVVEFVVANQQCPDCQASFTEHTWESCVQLRQHRKHKRTMFMLEQMLIKHRVCPDVMQVKQVAEGLDFYFKTLSQAKKLMDFIKASLPIRLNFGKKLISEDLNSNTHKHKYNYMIEIAPCCKDDIVMLSTKMANALSCVSNIMLCYRVSHVVHLIDPVTLKTCEILPERYWVDPPRVMLTQDRMVEYIVLDVNVLDRQTEYEQAAATSTTKNGRQDHKTNLTAFNKQTSFNNRICQAEVTIIRQNTNGVNNTQFTVISHLGRHLRAGDTVLGYDIAQHNLTDEAYSKRGDLPDAILVRKTYSKIKKRQERRKWKLKRIDITDDSEHVPKKSEIERQEREFESFMQEIEEDPDSLSNVNVYSKFNTHEEEMEYERRFGHLNTENDGDDDDFASLPDLLSAMVLNEAQEQIAVPATTNGDMDNIDMDYDDEDMLMAQAHQQQQQQTVTHTGRGLRNKGSSNQDKQGGFDQQDEASVFQPFQQQ